MVFEEMCTTCIFRPGNPYLPTLGADRIREVIETNRRQGTALPCHTSTHGQMEEKVICRGFYEAYKAENGVIQVVERLLGGFEEIPPPKEEK